MQKLTEINDELSWCGCIGLGNQLPSTSTGGAFLTSSLKWDFFVLFFSFSLLVSTHGTAKFQTSLSICFFFKCDPCYFNYYFLFEMV
jgi:hypothetical protein